MWLLILSIIFAVITIILFTIIEYRGFFPVTTLDYVLWIVLITFAIITFILFIVMIIKYLMSVGKRKLEELEL